MLVKGADYRLEQVVGGEEVRGWGGQVLLARLEPGFSTTATIAGLTRGRDSASPSDAGRQHHLAGGPPRFQRLQRLNRVGEGKRLRDVRPQRPLAQPAHQLFA